MSHPIVIIEIVDKKFETIYSNSELSFIIVSRSEDQRTVTVSGPFKPNLETDLTRVIDGVTTLHQVLDQFGENQLSGSEETP